MATQTAENSASWRTRAATAATPGPLAFPVTASRVSRPRRTVCGRCVPAVLVAP